jgi:hypothetical protein
MKEQIREILWNFVAGEVTDSEAIEQVLDLFAVLGRSEQYFCCKEQINQRCSEQCLGCFQFENKD